MNLDTRDYKRTKKENFLEITPEHFRILSLQWIFFCKVLSISDNSTYPHKKYYDNHHLRNGKNFMIIIVKKRLNWVALRRFRRKRACVKKW